jgi:hypothetical protein
MATSCRFDSGLGYQELLKKKSTFDLNRIAILVFVEFCATIVPLLRLQQKKVEFEGRSLSGIELASPLS